VGENCDILVIPLTFPFRKLKKGQCEQRKHTSEQRSNLARMTGNRNESVAVLPENIVERLLAPQILVRRGLRPQLLE
jgi:hypothetical protein